MKISLTLLTAAAVILPASAAAQGMPGMDMPGMHHPAPAKPSASATKKAKAKAKAKAQPNRTAKARRAPPTKPTAASPAPAAPPPMDHGAMGQMTMDPPAAPAAPAGGIPAPHGAMDHGAMAMPTPPGQASTPATDHSAMDHGAMGHDGMAMGTMNHIMRGALGAYSMTRDGSGTSWVPDSAPMMGPMIDLGSGWTGMAHGFATLITDHQGGPRGANKTFVASMLMGMAQRPLGQGTITLKGMASLDPLMGKSGYPLLLATGETADGRTELVDRQHPHDALAELSVTVSQPIGRDTSGFVYLAYPGEPAIGPTTYLHRFSGMGNPEAPISHHFLDSSHITFGVATAGVVHGPLKLEGSLFTGREPDQYRWDVEKPRFDSWSLRATLNPSPDWSLQVSHAFLKSSEGLHPEENVRRTTASATWNRPLANNGFWQTTLAYGRNRKAGGHHGPETTQAGLLESAAGFDRWGVFARGEVAGKEELFGDEAEGDPLAGRRFTVGKLSLGGYRSLPLGAVTIDVGATVSAFALPDALKPRYGASPKAFMLFMRVKLGRSLSPPRP